MSKILKEALTFDDVLLVPQHSKVVPADVCTKTVLIFHLLISTFFCSKVAKSMTRYVRELGT